MLGIARGGLKRRARLNARGEDETIRLRPLEAIAESGNEPARKWIERYEGPWGRSVDPAFDRGGFLERVALIPRESRPSAWLG